MPRRSPDRSGQETHQNQDLQRDDPQSTHPDGEAESAQKTLRLQHALRSGLQLGLFIVSLIASIFSTGIGLLGVSRETLTRLLPTVTIVGTLAALTTWLLYIMVRRYRRRDDVLKSLRASLKDAYTYAILVSFHEAASARRERVE